jgi:hypothetical protein
MRVFLLIATALILCACNLSDVRQNTPTPPSSQATDTPTDVLPSPLPGVRGTADPNALPSRTPAGNLQPTPTQLGIGGDAFAPIPTSATGERALISSPAEGTVVTNGTLQISGVITNLTRSDFTLALLAPNGASINTQTITLQSAPVGVRDVPWSAAMMVSRYTGPVEVQVRAQTAAGQEILLARTNIVIQAGAAANVSAPSSSTTPLVSIDSPVENSTASGSVIQITGSAGGIAENQFTLALVSPDGGVINSQLIMLTNPNITTVVPWAAALGSNGYRGAAEIRALVGSTILDTVRLTLQ